MFGYLMAYEGRIDRRVGHTETQHAACAQEAYSMLRSEILRHLQTPVTYGDYMRGARGKLSSVRQAPRNASSARARSTRRGSGITLRPSLAETMRVFRSIEDLLAGE